MKKVLIIIILFQFVHTLYSQDIVGLYTPKKILNSKNIFGNIPSDATLKINEDSSYYFHSFWGSFETENEYGNWKFVNDTLLLIPLRRFSEPVNNHLEIQYFKNESIKDSIRIRLMGSYFGIRNIKINSFRDNEMRTYISDNSGYILMKMDSSYYLRIDETDLLGNITDKIEFKDGYNDILIYVDVKLYILKGRRLLDYMNEIIAKKR